jgi:hypothetical protein
VNSNYRDDSSVDALRANALYVLLASIFGVWLIWDAAFYHLVTYAAWGDYWEHTAVFTEWLGNFSNPSNPHVDDLSLSPRYMPWFWALTFLGLVFQFDAVELMSISAVLNYGLIVIGLHVFLKTYFRDPWAPLIGFIVVFMFWGVSWNWSNLYHLRSFFYIAGFPSTFVFGLSLISFSLVMRLLRRDGSVFMMAALLCMLSALMFLCHPLTGVFGIVGCALLALTGSSESPGLRLLTLVALLLGAVFAELWPYFSVWKVSLGLYGAGTEQWFSSSEQVGALERLQSGVWSHIFYNPRLVLTILGPALIGLPLCVWLFIRREHMFIVLGAAAMAVPYLLHPFIEVPLAHRFLLFIVTYFHFAIVWGILQIIDAWNSRPRPQYARLWLFGLLAVFSIMLVANIILLSMEFRGNTLDPKNLQIVSKRSALPDEMSVIDLYTRLTDPLTDDAIVLATPIVGWPLPTVKGKVVSIYHENPMLLDQQERYVRTVEFFENAQSEGLRSGLIRDYDISHLLIKGQPLTPELNDWLNVHARPLVGVGEYRMYKLLPSATAAAPPPKPVEAERPIEVVPVVLPSAIAPPVNPAKISAGSVAPGEVKSPSQQQTRPKVSKPPRPITPAPAQSEDPAAGTYGAPIAEPLIPPVETSPPVERSSESSELQKDAEASAPPVPAQSAQPADTGEAEPEVYGAPISEPVLDPERHGG